MSLRRAVAVSALAALALAGVAAAKEGTTARLVSDVPEDARPGTTLRVLWTLGVDDHAERVSVLGAFVRLHDGEGRKTMALATERGEGSGLYSALATVPPGGIARLELGVIGSEEALMEVVNLPEHLAPEARGGGRIPWAVVAAILAGLGAIVLLLRRFPPRPAVAHR